MFARVVQEFKSKVALAGRALPLCNNPILMTPEGNEIIAEMLV